MKSWQEELLHSAEGAPSRDTLFECRGWRARYLAEETPTLTEREIEVLKWTADGKTSGEIADILAVSDNTVNFHIKNAVAKLRTANKTAAAVRAALLGLFN